MSKKKIKKIQNKDKKHKKSKSKSMDKSKSPPTFSYRPRRKSRYSSKHVRIQLQNLKRNK